MVVAWTHYLHDPKLTVPRNPVQVMNAAELAVHVE